MTEMDPSELLKTAGRYRLSQAIYAAASLGIADELQGGERTAEELANAVGAHQPHLRRLLRALSSEGVFRETEDGRFGLTPAGELLVSGGGAREMVLGWSLLPASYAAFGMLADSVRLGQPAFELANGQDFHAYLAAHPDAARAYDAATGSTVDAFDLAATTYDFRGIKTVVDVGGGDGGFLVAILKQHAAMVGINFDLPDVIASIKEGSFPPGTSDRLQLVGGDFFKDQIPSGDAFVLSTVLRLFEDDGALIVLKNIRRAMQPESKVLVLDFVHPPGPLVAPYGLADIHAMVVYGGRDRNEADFQRLFAAADIRLTRVIDTGELHSWVEGVRA